LSWLLSSSLATEDAELDFATKDIVFADLAFINIANLLMVYNYLATLVEMLDSFKQQLLKGYQQDPDYSQIIKVLNANNNLTDKNKVTILFVRDENSLIWHTRTNILWLCILQSLVSKVLKIAYTNVRHPRAAQTFEQAVSSWYICCLS